MVIVGVLRVQAAELLVGYTVGFSIFSTTNLQDIIEHAMVGVLPKSSLQNTSAMRIDFAAPGQLHLSLPEQRS